MEEDIASESCNEPYFESLPVKLQRNRKDGNRIRRLSFKLKPVEVCNKSTQIDVI